MVVKLKINRGQTIAAPDAGRIVLKMSGTDLDPCLWRGYLHGQPRAFMRRVRDCVKALKGSQVRRLVPGVS